MGSAEIWEDPGIGNVSENQPPYLRDEGRYKKSETASFRIHITTLQPANTTG